jgi:hypothetical protein
MAEQQAGGSDLLTAGVGLAESALLLVPPLLAATSYLSPELPLHAYWTAVRTSAMQSLARLRVTFA